MELIHPQETKLLFCFSQEPFSWELFHQRNGKTWDFRLFPMLNIIARFFFSFWNCPHCKDRGPWQWCHHVCHHCCRLSSHGSVEAPEEIIPVNQEFQPCAFCLKVLQTLKEVQKLPKYPKQTPKTQSPHKRSGRNKGD